MVLAACMAVASLAPVAQAQVKPENEDYRFVSGDRILISVPERPSMNQEATIDKEGNVTLPLVGEIQVAGLTAAEIEAKLYLALRDFLPSLGRNDITVEPAKGLIIYVTGAVGSAGKYTFQTAPNLWSAIREAGGPTGDAALNDVQIIKDGAKGGTSQTVDVQHAVDTGTMDSLPLLEEGDTVIIGSRETSYTGTFGVNIFGEVNSPGMYRLQAKQDLASALLLAGGPTDRAKLSDIKVVRGKEQGGFETYQLNLDEYLKHGKPDQNIMLKPGDTVTVPKQNSVAYAFKNNPALFVSILASVVTVTALVLRK